MRRYRVLVGRVLLFGFVLLAAGEGAGLARYFHDHGTLYYVDRPHVEALAKDSARDDTITKRRLHPILGFIWSEPGVPVDGTALTVNNYGYFSERGDYPFAGDRTKEFVVGIFGGSVASQVFQLGRRRLAAQLADHPLVSKRDVVVLSFAQAGYKQPQQLLSLSYFLSIGQHFDLVLNLDGFNEVALSERNQFRGVATTLPSASHMLQMMELCDAGALTPRKLELLANIGAQRRDLDALAVKINRNPSALVHELLSRMYNRALGGYKRALAEYEMVESDALQTSLFYLERSSPVSDEVLFGSLADYWARCSVLMDTLVRSNGGTYYHFLQPNQYYSARQFSVDEARVAINEKHIYRRGAIGGYPRLVEQLPRLTEAGVHAYSCVAAVDGAADAVYADDCCHFTPRGVELIVDDMAGHVLETLPGEVPGGDDRSGIQALPARSDRPKG